MQPVCQFNVNCFPWPLKTMFVTTLGTDGQTLTAGGCKWNPNAVQARAPGVAHGANADAQQFN